MEESRPAEYKVTGDDGDGGSVFPTSPARAAAGVSWWAMGRVVLPLALAATTGCGPGPANPDFGDPTSGGPATSTVETGTTEPTGSGTSTLAPVPDLPPVDAEAHCAAWCDRRMTCFPDSMWSGCVANCVAGLGRNAEPDAACVAADAALLDCQTGLPCADFYGDPDACDGFKPAVAIACNLCWLDGGWVDEGECFVQDLCPTQTRRVDCDASGCVCTIDGAVVANCPGDTCDVEGYPLRSFGCCP